MTAFSTNELVNRIISSATAPTEIKPIPRVNRFGLKTNVYLMDEVPKNSLYLEKEMSLDWWNDVEGFVNANNGRIVDFRSSEWDIPAQTELISRESACKNSDGSPLFVVGDRIVTKDYNVLKVVGFISNGGSSNYYFDIK